MKDKKITVNRKFYYAVLTGCLMIIIGISAFVYNFSVPKNAVSNKETTSQSRISYTKSKTESNTENEAANYTPTGIPKPAETTSAATTIPESEKPYTGSFCDTVSGKVINDYSEGELVKNETMGDWRIHNGTDFSTDENESVHSVQSCTVTAVDKDEMWGVCVTTQCPGNLTVKYCGLSDSVTCKTGDKIAKGGIIGKSGSIPAESAMQSHIHIETYVDGKAVNPLRALNMM